MDYFHENPSDERYSPKTCDIMQDSIAYGESYEESEDTLKSTHIANTEFHVTIDSTNYIQDRATIPLKSVIKDLIRGLYFIWKGNDQSTTHILFEMTFNQHIRRDVSGTKFNWITSTITDALQKVGANQCSITLFTKFFTVLWQQQKMRE